MKAIWENNTPYSKFLISVGIILISAVLFTIIGSVAATFIFAVSMEELQAMIVNREHPNSIAILKIMQTFSAIGTFVIPPVLIACLFSQRPASFLSVNKVPQGFSFLVVAVIMIIATPAINFLGELNAQMHLPGFLRSVEDWMRETEKSAAELTRVFLIMNTPTDLLVNLFVIALIPAIGEELLFRGVIQKLFHQWSRNAHVAVWASAILFSAMHMQFYGFVPRLILGVMLGYMLVWSGSLWLPVVAHFVNNAGAVIFIYMFRNGYSTIDPDKIGTGSDFNSVLGSIVFTVLLLIVLVRKEKSNQALTP